MSDKRTMSCVLHSSLITHHSLLITHYSDLLFFEPRAIFQEHPRLHVADLSLLDRHDEKGIDRPGVLQIILRGARGHVRVRVVEAEDLAAGAPRVPLVVEHLLRL